jgi:putative ABC transport system substrate-binding protein
MRRRRALHGIAALVVAVPMAALGQRRTPVKIGWLAIEPIASNLDAFREGLREAGYGEGIDLVIEQRYAHDVANFAAMAAELARLDVDVIVTTGSTPARAVQRVAAGTPIVFITADPVSTGLVPSLSHPGGNLTGLATLSYDLLAKRVQLLKELLPGMRSFAVLNDAAQTIDAQRAFLMQAREAAKQVGIEYRRSFDVAKPDEVDSAFDAAAKAGANAMVVVTSAWLHANKERVVEAATRVRMPTIYEHADFVRIGGLVSYGPDMHVVFRTAATYVDKILKGAPPATLPVEQIRKIELVINTKTAKALDLAIPQSVRLRADEVIQ